MTTVPIQTQSATTIRRERGQKLAILSIGIFLLIGLAALSFVNEKKARSFH